LQEIPPSDPVDQEDEGDWETVGELAERSCSPAPTVEELVSRLTQLSTTLVELPAPVVENRTEPVVTAAAEEPVATQAEEEVPVEAGLVDIASILGAPTVTIVRSSL
jgi:GAF domain-containing protein